MTLKLATDIYINKDMNYPIERIYSYYKVQEQHYENGV
jgi:hypothetical protein